MSDCYSCFVFIVMTGRRKLTTQAVFCVCVGGTINRDHSVFIPTLISSRSVMSHPYIYNAICNHIRDDWAEEINAYSILRW